MKFDTSTCWYDCYIYIEQGYAEAAGFRTLVGASYNVVVDEGTSITIAQSHMPLQNNQNYSGTVPAPWNIGPSAYDANGLGIDIHRLSPTLNPSAQFDNIYTGDTIKLFSLDVEAPSNCQENIRLYINGVDPNNINGGDYDQGMTIGVFANYNGNFTEEYAPAPEVEEINVDSMGVINIDIDVASSTCLGPLTYAWTGPNGYQSSDEDVSITSPSASDYGTYNLTVTNALGCTSTYSRTVQNPGGSSQVLDILSSSIILNATFEHLAVHLNIVGDDNNDASCSVEYRLLGESSFSPGAMMMRASPDLIVDGASLGMNFFAGSAMHLLPNSSYELKISLNDPDGGSQTIYETIQTKRFPSIPESNTVVYVSPGNGGGDGTMGNPYLGIQDAMDNVSSGYTIIVSDGTYSPFILDEGGTSTAPIVIKSANLHGAVIDGQNTTTGVVTIGTFSDSIQHVIIDGLDIRNGKWGIDAQNTQYFTVQNSKISDVDFGIYNRRENGWEHDQYFNNNELVGRTSWPQVNGEVPGERGIDIRGNKNVISYNSISNFGDGISTDGAPYLASYALDIHNNMINRVVDDIIEIDGSVSNTRVYKNKGFNGRMGVSLAPVFGGPAYIFKNQFYNLETSAFKMNRSPSGLIIINNTIAKANRGMTSAIGWQNTVFKNNAVLSSHYNIEEFSLVAGSVDDWNNNAYYSLRAGTSTEPWFKFDNIKYNNIAAISASGVLEADAVEIDETSFVNIVVPADFSVEALISDVDLSPSAGSILLNEGVMFDNILNGEIDGLGPDIGALEDNIEVPHYGHDFDAVCDVDSPVKTWIGTEGKGWFHPLNWSPCGVPSESTEVIIPNFKPEYPFSNTIITIGNLSIYSGGSLELEQNVELRITNGQ